MVSGLAPHTQQGGTGAIHVEQVLHVVVDLLHHLAHVTQLDRHHLVVRVPGDFIRFSLIEVSEAQAIVRDQRARLDAVLPPLRPANTS